MDMRLLVLVGLWALLGLTASNAIDWQENMQELRLTLHGLRVELASLNEREAKLKQALSEASLEQSKLRGLLREQTSDSEKQLGYLRVEAEALREQLSLLTGLKESLIASKQTCEEALAMADRDRRRWRLASIVLGVAVVGMGVLNAF